MKNPGTILRLWNKTVKKHEEGKKPEDMPKKGQEEKFKIKKGLTTLKLQAPATPGNPAAQAKFVALRDRTVKVMTKYCRYLKSSKDEDKKTLPKYLKTVKQLTVTVQKLDPTALDLAEEEAGVESLDAVDTAALDEALAKPDTEAEGNLDAPLPEDMIPGKTDTAEAPPSQDAAKKLAAAMAKLTPAIKAAAANPARAKDLLGAVTRFHQELKDNVEDARKTLLDIANLLKAPAATPPAGQGEWKSGLAALMPKLKKALESGAGNQDVIKKLFTKANELAGDQDFRQANLALKGLGGLVDAALKEAQQAATTNGAPPSAARAVQAWEAARKAAGDQLAYIQKEMEGEDAPVAKQAAAKVAKILPNLDERLSTVVKQYEAARTANGDAADLAALRTQALQLVEKVLAYVSGGGLLARLDANRHYPMNLRGPLQKALTELQASLAPA